MGLTFKSNIASVKKLSLASGFLGPQDFKTYADFNTQEYLKNGNEVTLSNIISSQRSAVSYALSSDVLDNFSIVPINTPIRSYIYDYKTFGIYPDWADRINRMLDVRSDQVWIGSIPEDNVIYSIYSLDSGNATVNTAEFNVLSGNGSAESPMYFKHLSNGVPKLANITRLNGCLSCVVQTCYFGETLLVPHKDQTIASNETLKIEIDSSSQGTIFFKVAGAKRKALQASPLTPLMQLKQNANNYLSVAIQPDNAVSLRYFINGVEAGFFKSNKVFISRENLNKFALSWSNGVITLSANGQTEFIAALSMGAEFRPIESTIISPISGWLDVVSNMSLFELATYNRRLVTTEMGLATSG